MLISPETQQHETRQGIRLSEIEIASLKKKDAYLELYAEMKRLGRGGSSFWKRKYWNLDVDIQQAVKLIARQTGYQLSAIELSDKRGWTLQRSAR